MTRLLIHTGERASWSEPSSAALLASYEPRAPTAILSSAKRAALIACLNGGGLHKQCGPMSATNPSPASRLRISCATAC